MESLNTEFPWLTTDIQNHEIFCVESESTAHFEYDEPKNQIAIEGFARQSTPPGVEIENFSENNKSA